MTTETERQQLIRPPYIYPKTRQFLLDAIGTGAFEIPEELRKNKEGEELARANNILGGYYLGPASLDAVGKFYPGVGRKHISRERVRQIVRDRMRQIWEGSEILQRKYSFDEIPLNKPLSHFLMIRRSEAINSTSVKARNLILQGERDPKKLARELGVKKGDLNAIRPTLKRWGLTFDEFPVELSQFEQAKGKFDELEDNVKLQELLDSIPNPEIRELSNRARHLEPILLSLGNICRDEGFHFRSLKSFVGVLREAKLPVRSARMKADSKTRGKSYPVIYWVIPAKRKEQVIEAINASAELKPLKILPVELIFGIWDKKLPSTDELFDKRNFDNVESAVREVIGRRLTRVSEIHYPDLLEGTTIPIFKSNRIGSLFFPSERREELKVYIQKKYRSLKSV